MIIQYIPSGAVSILNAYLKHSIRYNKYNITSAWAVDREFLNIYWAPLGPKFAQFGSSWIQIGSNLVPIGSHWPLWGQKWSWPVGSQNCENLVASKVIIHCKYKAFGSVRQKHEKKSSKSYVFF